MKRTHFLPWMLFFLVTIPLASRAQKIFYSEPEKDDNRRTTNFEIIGRVGGNILIFKNNRADNAISVYDNEMKLTDEYWINYQKGKGSEEFQKYMEDLTDMQNHVLPYLQSFCNLEEKGVKERREQQIAERYEGRADERVTSTEANEVVKDVGKTDRKPAQQKQAVDGKDKKLSIHERLEINKRIIQEKQGKDKTERGVDLGVRTV